MRYMADYVRIEHEFPEYASYVVINWCLSNICNYACSYCPDELHNRSRQWLPLEEIKGFCERAIRHYEGKKLYFEFTGGEVTLWRDFIPLCSHLKSLGAEVGFISNGSRALDWWASAIPHFDQVCLSFHSELAKPGHFLDVVKLLHRDRRVHVNVMMKPETFDYCVEFARKVIELENVSIALQPLVIDFQDRLYVYTDAQKAVLAGQQENFSSKVRYTRQFTTYRGSMAAITRKGERNVFPAHHFIATGMNNWFGWDCYIGVEQIVVDMLGNIKRGWCDVGGVIGNILDPKLMLPVVPIRCNKTMCHCNFDIMATKIDQQGP